jgi:hypothetical protein
MNGINERALTRVAALLVLAGAANPLPRAPARPPNGHAAAGAKQFDAKDLWR